MPFKHRYILRIPHFPMCGSWSAVQLAVHCTGIMYLVISIRLLCCECKQQIATFFLGSDVEVGSLFVVTILCKLLRCSGLVPLHSGWWQFGFERSPYECSICAKETIVLFWSMGIFYPPFLSTPDQCSVTTALKHGYSWTTVVRIITKSSDTKVPFRFYGY